MQALFSCLYGSRLYGTALPESDWDWKEICLPDLRELLLHGAPRNTVKKTNTAENTKNTADDIDRELIPIHVFARDFMEGQTYALELAYAVNYTEGGQQIHHRDFTKFCSELRSKFQTSTMHAMVQFAKRQAEVYSVKGERLNAARAMLEVFWGFVPTSKLKDCSHSLVAAVAPVHETYGDLVRVGEYNSDGKGKMAPCLHVLDRIIPFTNTFETAMGLMNTIIGNYGHRAQSASKDNVDWKAVMHAVRIVNEGIVLLNGDPLVYPYKPGYVAHLLSIRAGEHRYDEMMETIKEKLDVLVDMEKRSSLPPLSIALSKQLEDWLLGWLERFYRKDMFDAVARAAKSDWAPEVSNG